MEDGRRTTRYHNSARVMGNVKVFVHRYSDLTPGNDNHTSHEIRPNQLNRFHEQICKVIPSFCNSSSVLLHQEVPFVWRGVVLQDSHMEIFEFTPEFFAVHRVSCIEHECSLKNRYKCFKYTNLSVAPMGISLISIFKTFTFIVYPTFVFRLFNM